MNRDQFQQAVAADPDLAGPIERAAAASTPTQFGTLTDLAALTLMYPIVRYMVVHIGLPWLHEAKRYSELWRQKLHRWIDQEHQKEGFDPDQAEAASEALRQELEELTGLSARASWERLAAQLNQETADPEQPSTDA